MKIVNITSNLSPTGGCQNANPGAAKAGQGRGRKAKPTTDDMLGERFLERFTAFVRKEAPGGCWLWTAGVDAYGYGQIARRGKPPIKAHRAAWMLAHGPIASTQHVLHRCDVTRCVNPRHLFLGDQNINMKDAARKGRLRGNRKLTDAQILDIKARYRPRHNGKALAQEFGVTVITVCRIAAGTQRVHQVGG